MATTLASQVQELYVGYLGRAADKAGLDFWVKAIENGTSTLESVALGFTLSEEYKAQYNGLTTTQLVAKVYQNVLGRAADADGLAFWAGEVNKGVIKADTLVKTMIGSLGAIDQLTIDNKVAAANAYTVAAGDKYSVEAGKAAVVNAGTTVPGASTPGQTFTLTAGAAGGISEFADSTGAIVGGGAFSTAGFKFSAANEIVNGTTATLGVNDTLTDASTNDNDTLNVAANAAVAIATAAAGPGVGVASAGAQFTATNIENLNFNFSGGLATYDIDLANVTGAKTLTLAGATSAATAIVVHDGAMAGVTAPATPALTALNGTGITTLDASGLTTAAGTLTVAFGGTSTAALTVKGHNGADTITTANGNDVVIGGAGADVINVSSGDDTVTGGIGNDTITLGAGADTVIFESTGALNGTDTIQDLAVADKLNFGAFLSGGSVDARGSAGYVAADNSDVDIANKVVFFDTGAATAGLNVAGLVAEIQGAGNAFALNGKAVVITGNTDNVASTALLAYYVDSSLDGVATDVTAADVVQVMLTGNNFDMDTILAANILFA